MKIRWITTPSMDDDIEIEIKAPDQHPQKLMLERMLSHLEGFVLGEKDRQKYRIFYKDIYYFNHHDDQTTIVTKSDQFYSSYRLYEIEGFSDLFVRIHKSLVVNITKIKSFRSTFNGKLEVTLLNQNRLEISRNYVNQLKKALEEHPL
jgi:DNA-binding LytR/AlgR family response regulator